MTFLAKVKAIFVLVVGKSGPVSRELYPRSLYMDWEFIPQGGGGIIARVYTKNGPLEEIFYKMASAERWVHANMELARK